jgi:predicted lipid-binding transport protein (Tim44 family)
MSDSSSYADIIILALIAVFILLRLRSVLGDKVGHDSPNYFNKIKQAEAPQRETIVKLEDKPLKVRIKEDDPYLASLKDKELVATLETMHEKDPQFTATAFLEGAKMAYEMVFDAFAKGDRKTLEVLLSDDILATFSKELEARESEDNKTETTLISVKAKGITQASLNGSVARISVDFASEQIVVVRNSDGDIVEGSASEVEDVEDNWVFERNVTSKNPNWKIIET